MNKYISPEYLFLFIALFFVSVNLSSQNSTVIDKETAKEEPIKYKYFMLQVPSPLTDTELQVGVFTKKGVFVEKVDIISQTTRGNNVILNCRILSDKYSKEDHMILPYNEDSKAKKTKLEQKNIKISFDERQ